VTLKEHFEKLLEERDKALNAALIASDKRLDLLNELRTGVATKEELNSLSIQIQDLKARIDKSEGGGAGIQKFIGWIIAAIAIIGFIISIRYK